MNDDIHSDHGYLDTWDNYAGPPQFLILHLLQKISKTAEDPYILFTNFL